jgi:hypothetical protein
MFPNKNESLLKLKSQLNGVNSDPAVVMTLLSHNSAVSMTPTPLSVYSVSTHWCQWWAVSWFSGVNDAADSWQRYLISQLEPGTELHLTGSKFIWQVPDLYDSWIYLILNLTDTNTKPIRYRTYLITNLSGTNLQYLIRGPRGDRGP